jgi:hypothetical protein
LTSQSSQPNTPRCALKNNNTFFEAVVLPSERLSIGPVVRVLGELLVDPTLPVMAPPNLSKSEPTRNRAPRNEDGPKMPGVSPCRSSSRTFAFVRCPDVRKHLRSHGESHRSAAR